jgi:syntenin-1
MISNHHIISNFRPFERSVTLVRDSLGHIGFQFRDGKIINIVKDSSAARNGLLTDHNLLEINGKNVIGLKDKEITKVIQGIEGTAMNVTIMPTFLFSHMVKEMNTSLFGKMDHSDF